MMDRRRGAANRDSRNARELILVLLIDNEAFDRLEGKLQLA